ncbi:MAG: DUF6485 family protein [Candidatus Omnitrophota bacterium]
MQRCNNYKENVEGCSCTYKSCGKRGVCCECVRYHIASGEIPGCFFPKEAEKTYDRSVENFIKTQK